MSAVGLAVPALLAVAFLALERRARRRAPGRTAAGLGGIAALAIALGTPLAARSDELLSLHMVQHLLLQSVAAPLLVLAAPVTLVLRALPRSRARVLVRGLRHPVVRTLGRPGVGVAAFALMLAAVHLEPVYEGALRHPLLHDVEHAALFWSAVWLWAPLLRADPLPHAPGPIGRASGLILGMTAMTAVGAVLATVASASYPTYVAWSDAGRALADQQVAGSIMWIASGVIGLPILLVVAWRALVEEDRRVRVRSAASAGDAVVPQDAVEGRVRA